LLACTVKESKKKKKEKGKERLKWFYIIPLAKEDVAVSW
jgi:hypothetical protein